jgi:hypothetical protein
VFPSTVKTTDAPVGDHAGESAPRPVLIARVEAPSLSMILSSPLATYAMRVWEIPRLPNTHCSI